MSVNSTTRIPEFSATFFYAAIPKSVACIFGSITNAICIAVFLSPKMKDISFKYMLAQSISDFIYLFALSFQLLYYCSINKIRQSLPIQLFIITVDDYVTSALAIFYILVEIWISFQRYLILKNKKLLENVSYKRIISFFAVFSFIYYFPAIFLHKVVTVSIFNNSTQKNQTFYFTEKTKFAD